MRGTSAGLQERDGQHHPEPDEDAAATASPSQWFISPSPPSIIARSSSASSVRTGESATTKVDLDAHSAPGDGAGVIMKVDRLTSDDPRLQDLWRVARAPPDPEEPAPARQAAAEVPVRTRQGVSPGSPAFDGYRGRTGRECPCWSGARRRWAPQPCGLGLGLGWIGHESWADGH